MLCQAHAFRWFLLGRRKLWRSPEYRPYLTLPRMACVHRNPKVALGLFRLLVQKEINYKSDQSGYAGLIDEAQNYMVVQVTFRSAVSPALLTIERVSVSTRRLSASCQLAPRPRRPVSKGKRGRWQYGYK